jgi:alpha-galactosidase
VRLHVLKRFGFYSTGSNGHLSGYLPWYRTRPEEIGNRISLDDWIHGETGGYPRYATGDRNWFETDFPKALDEAGKPPSACSRTDGHVSHILEAIWTGRTSRGHFSVKNGGVIRSLPEACAATCSASVDVRRMGMKAAVTGDAVLLKQAVLHNPLVGAICTPQEVWRMVDDLRATRAGAGKPDLGKRVMS